MAESVKNDHAIIIEINDERRRPAFPRKRVTRQLSPRGHLN